MYEKYDLDEGGTELRWSQDKVVLISNGSNIIKQGARTACYKVGETVLILWDANEERNESSSTSSLRLLPSKWNPKGQHSDGTWRMDVILKQLVYLYILFPPPSPIIVIYLYNLFRDDTLWFLSQ